MTFWLNVNDVDDKGRYPAHLVVLKIARSQRSKRSNWVQSRIGTVLERRELSVASGRTSHP